MSSDNYSVQSDYLLQKMNGKGGWTYVLIPEIAQDKSRSFGWVTIDGFIDDFELKQVKLMPAKGQLFLAVNAQMRKKIKKEAGDWVRIQIVAPQNLIEQKDILDCLEFEGEEVLNRFLKLRTIVQEQKLKDVLEAANEDLKTQKINQLIDFLKR